LWPGYGGAGSPIGRSARELGTTKSVVAYHARRLGVEADDRFAKRYDWDEIRRAYENEGLTVRECMARFGFTGATWCKAIGRGDVTPRPRRLSLEELLVAGRKRGR
jgi:hypothetical protein